MPTRMWLSWVPAARVRHSRRCSRPAGCGSWSSTARGCRATSRPRTSSSRAASACSTASACWTDLLAVTPPLTAFTLVNEDVRIETAIPTDVAPTLCVRRVTLDVALADAAARAGADVRTGVTVRGVRTSGGRVVGVDTDAGPITADLVVGADGRNSVIARSVGAVEYATIPAGRMPIWGYFEGVRDHDSRLRLARLGDLAFLACPCDGGLVPRRHRARHGRPRHGVRGARADLRIGYRRLAGACAGARRSAPGGPVAHRPGLVRLPAPAHRTRLAAHRRRRSLQGPDAGTGDRGRVVSRGAVGRPDREQLGPGSRRRARRLVGRA